jgi:pyruvate-formate lyase-activating enzyme
MVSHPSTSDDPAPVPAAPAPAAAARTVLALVEQVGALAVGQTVRVPVAPGDAPTVAAWCRRTGNELISTGDGVAVVRRGVPAALADPIAALAPQQRPGARLWIYTNFDCNLACDYCCARSSPRAERRAIGADRIATLAAEAAREGVAEILLTGGEPFLLTDLDVAVAACTAHLPTTVLTNGMLFRGSRLLMLRRMPRQRLALQISLDSATADRHDRHRGAGTWQRALDGIRIALREGFRVRVAATVATGEDDRSEEAALHALLDELGIPPEDRVVRPVARRGFAAEGVELTTEALVPEVTVTAEGVYWHPVGADHPDQLVTRQIVPLGPAIAEVRRRFVEYRRTADLAAERFPCA